MFSRFEVHMEGCQLGGPLPHTLISSCLFRYADELLKGIQMPLNIHTAYTYKYMVISFSFFLFSFILNSIHVLKLGIQDSAGNVI